MSWLRDEPRGAWRWVDGNGEVLAEVGDQTMRRAPLDLQVAWVSRIRSGLDPVAAGCWTRTAAPVQASPRVLPCQHYPLREG